MLRLFCVCAFALSACRGGLGLQGVVGLADACASGSARICKCDGGGDGAQLCGSAEVWDACDCTLVLAAAFCASDYVPGQEAKCVGTAPTCVLQAPAPGLLGNTQRVSDVAAPFAARFEVHTDANADSVLLTAEGQRYVVVPQQGVAVFDAVALAGDGAHNVNITCIGNGGVPRALDTAHYVVDSTPPGLTLQQPASQQHYGPSTPLQACFTTTGDDLAQVCVSVASAPERCSTQDACIPLDCPGGPPFSVSARAVDKAGNETKVVATDVSCASTTPSALVADPSMNDHVLAFNQASAPKKDNDGERFNAQYDVKVCTSISQGSARLFGGLAGAPAAVIATSTDFRPQQGECPGSYGYFAVFAGATLPESTALPDDTLEKATRLYAEIEDVSREIGTSASVDIWVDTSLPFLWGALNNYNSALCGFSVVSAVPYTTTSLVIVGTTTNFSVALQNSAVNGGLPYAPTGSTGVLVDPVYSSKQWSDITFELGTTQVLSTITEPSGNVASIGPCAVTVGDALNVRWLTPTMASRALNILNQGPSGNTGDPGWQGLLSVQVDDAAGATVDFTTSTGAVLATGITCAPTGSVCVAETTVSILDTPDLTLVATATAGGRSPGSASLAHLPVDTLPPTGVSNVSAIIVDRRGGVFDLTWTAGDDQGARLQSYEVYALRDLPIGEPLPTGAERLAFNAVPAMPGQADGLRIYDRIIERNYGFAVCPKDRAGNRGACATVQDVKAKLNVSVFPALFPLENPAASDGACDLDGDGGADLLVGGYVSRAYLYLSQKGAMPSGPTTTFVGPPNTYFGYLVRCAGDLDGDGKKDILIGAGNDGNGRVYFYRGRSTWPQTLNTSDADSVIELDASTDPTLAQAYLGTDAIAIGDFDQDGADDVAIGVSYNFDSVRNWAQDFVLIYRGVLAPAVLPPRVVSPRDEGTRLIRIMGEPQPDSHYFGYGMHGLGSFYPGAGTTFTACGWSGRASAARAYAMTGTAAMPFQQSIYDHEIKDTPCTQSKALGSVYGRPVPARIGTHWTLPTAPSGVQWQYLIDFSFTDAQQGAVNGRTVRLVNDRFADQGWVSGAGAFSNMAAGVSVFGGSEPDFVLSMQPNPGQPRMPLYGWRSTTLAQLSAGIEYPMSTTADFVYEVPLPWAQMSVDTLVGDMNGDGYAEIAVTEITAYNDTPIDGSFAILW